MKKKDKRKKEKEMQDSFVQAASSQPPAASSAVVVADAGEKLASESQALINLHINTRSGSVSEQTSCQESRHSILDQGSNQERMWTEKREMEDKINKMEEDFTEKRKSWQDKMSRLVGQHKYLHVKFSAAEQMVKKLEEEVKTARTDFQESLRALKEENDRSVAAGEKERKEAEEQWESRWEIREESVVALLSKMEEDWERKVSQVEEEMKVTTSFVEKMKALKEEHELTLKGEMAAKEESWQRTMKQKEKEESEWEKMWLTKEEEWIKNMSAMEEERKLQNAQIQELTKKKKRRFWSKIFSRKNNVNSSDDGKVEISARLAQAGQQ